MYKKDNSTDHPPKWLLVDSPSYLHVTLLNVTMPFNVLSAGKRVMDQELVEDRTESARHRKTASGPGLVRRRAEEDFSLIYEFISHKGTYM